MQQLLGDKAGAADGSFLKELFLQCLPSNVRMVLASTNDGTSRDQFAQLADNIVEVAAPSVSAVPASSFMDEMEQLRSEVVSLKKLIQSLSSASQRRRPSLSHGRSPSPARPCSLPDTSLCWYHQKFGEDAKKCRLPCSMSTSGNEQAEQ